MPQNLFAACRNDGALVAKRIRLDQAVQEAVGAIFDLQETQFREGITSEVPFDGSWKPDDDEFLTIDLPEEAGIFVDAVAANALEIPEIDAANFEAEGIKALFTGSCVNGACTVLVQQFLPKQILGRRFTLLQDGNVFRRLSDPAFCLDTALTCIIEGGRVKFKSFHKLRSIISLMEVYRAATDDEVQAFAEHPHFHVADQVAFVALADQTTRKLVHAISSSGVLGNYSVADIAAGCRQVGMTVAVNNGRLVIPTDRAKVKMLLRFLDDGLYQAPLTGNRYVTNSKRPA